MNKSETSAAVVRRKYVSGSEPFALGHYAGAPVYPGVLTVDLLIKAAEELVASVHGRAVANVTVSRFQFLDRIVPGDALELTAHPRTAGFADGIVNVVAKVGSVVKARGQLQMDLGELLPSVQGAGEEES